MRVEVIVATRLFQKLFQVGEIIPGLKGVVATCPQDIDKTPELNYSIFFKEKNS